MSLAIFDLDNTLIAGDSDHSWGQFLVDRNIVNAEEFKKANDQFYEDYKNGTLNIFAYQEFALKPLTEHSMDELHTLRGKFISDCISPLMLRKAEALITEHRKKGDRLLIITATNRFVTEPIAEALGISEMLATEPEIVNNRYTGKIVGTPCFQEGKVIRLNEWLNKNQLSMQNSYFYSDSINDLPLLEVVENPVAVDPDNKLREEAEKRDWKIISLR